MRLAIRAAPDTAKKPAVLRSWAFIQRWHIAICRRARSGGGVETAPDRPSGAMR